MVRDLVSLNLSCKSEKQMRRTNVRLRNFRVQYTSPSKSPVPAAQRWDLKLAKARLWQEHIDPSQSTAWQLEDERHLNPEYNDFLGYPTRKLKPGDDSLSVPKNIMNRRMPNQTYIDLHGRRDMPFQNNLLFGKTLYESKMYGVVIPYTWAMFKQMQAASRNDRKLCDKFRARVGSGFKNPPPGYKPIPYEDENKEE